MKYFKYLIIFWLSVLGLSIVFSFFFFYYSSSFDCYKKLKSEISSDSLVATRVGNFEDFSFVWSGSMTQGTNYCSIKINSIKIYGDKGHMKARIIFLKSDSATKLIVEELK